MPQKKSRRGTAKGQALLKKLGVAKGAKKRVAARAAAINASAQGRARRRSLGTAKASTVTGIARIARRAKRAGLSGKAFRTAVTKAAAKKGLLVSRKGKKSIGFGGSTGGRKGGLSALQAGRRVRRKNSVATGLSR